MFLDLQDPDPLVRGTDPDPLERKKERKKEIYLSSSRDIHL
jgi:hypothetical protein